MKNWADRWAEDWTGADRRCETCKWHDDYTGACYNSDSDYRADFTTGNCLCEEWEARE